MPSGTQVSLLRLADREFRELTGKPVAIAPSRKFKPIKLNAAKFENGWSRKRVAAVRLTTVLLRDDDAALERRVCENDKSAKTYASAAAWLQRESTYLRRMAKLLDTAGGRLTAVLSRCRDDASSQSP
jgi:hypothetical protein